MVPKVRDEMARQEILEALRRLDYETTESELVVATGIVPALVKETLRELAKEYRCERRLNENAEVIYRFARGLQLRPDCHAGRGAVLRRAEGAAGGFIRWFFKRLLLLPLVGYFALFIFLPLPPGLLVFALLMACCWIVESLLRRGRRCAPSAPIARVPGTRRLDRPGSCIVRPVTLRISNTRRFGGLAAMYEAVYGYLFARSSRALSRWKRAAARDVLGFLRRRGGMVSRAEIMGLTGLTAQEAGRYGSELLRAYRGEPAVTEGGSVIHRFNWLLTSSRPSARLDHPASPKSDRGGSGEDRSEATQRFGGLITFMNGLNLFFGTFYGALVFGRIATAAGGGAAAERDASGVWRFLGGVHSLIASGVQYFHPLAVAVFVFGIIPAGIAAVYFALHIAARRERTRLRRTMQRRRLRKVVYSHVISHPESVDPRRIVLGSGERAGTASRGQVERTVDELAVAYGAEIEDTGSGHYVYRFPELEHEMHDLDSVRLSARRDGVS